MFAISISNGWTVLLQTVSLLIGALSALVLMKKLLQKHAGEDLQPGWRQRLPMLLVTAAYCLLLWP